MQSRSTKILMRQSGEAAVYTVFMALAIFSLLALIGLAIDSGRAFRTQRLLQNACDAGAAAGTRLLTESSEDFGKGKVMNIARGLALENLKLMGINPSENPFRITSNPMLGPRRNVTCEASLREPTTFMGALFGAADTRPSAQSSAYNVQFEISLVVDLSSSMDDPASEQGTCPSECDRWCNAAQGGAIRLNLAKCAANYFIDGLNDNDRVAITSFAMHDLTDVDPQFRENIDDFLDDALLEMPMTPNLNRDTRDRVKEVIDGLQMYNQRLLSDPTQTLDPQNPNAATYNQYGGTNIAAGLRLGGQQFPGSAPPAYTKRMLVLLTDGAPSIYWPIWGTPLEEVQNDPYYQCQSGSPSNTLITNCYSQGVPGGAACPFFDDHRYDYVPRHMRFLDAIAESDRVRDRMSASIYTIGLGAIDSNLNSHFQTEPVDNLNENFLPGADNIKWALLARVANDQPMMINPLFPYAPLIISGSPQDDTAPPATDYSWDFPCMRTGSTIRNKPQGKFYHASDGAASLAAFYDILKERTRVVK